MPENMAVEVPGSWIVGVGLKYHVAVRWNKLDVSTLGIFGPGDGGSVPDADADVEDVHVICSG